MNGTGASVGDGAKRADRAAHKPSTEHVTLAVKDR
jgi:hypothetical protein